MRKSLLSTSSTTTSIVSYHNILCVFCVCVLCRWCLFHCVFGLNLFLGSVVATTIKNANVALIFQFLHRLVEVYIIGFISPCTLSPFLSASFPPFLLSFRCSGNISENLKKKASEITLFFSMNYLMS